MILINGELHTLPEALEYVRKYFGVDIGPVLSSER
jgi:hypothetical protein